MNHRFAIVGVFGVLVAIGIPFYLASQMGIGSYAKSPQIIEIPLKSKRLIAGGRAKLWYAGGPSGTDFQISCTKDGRYVSAIVGEKYDACNLFVTMTSKPKTNPARAEFRVEWAGSK